MKHVDHIGMTIFGITLAVATLHLVAHGLNAFNLTAVVVSLPGLILSSYKKDKDK